MDFEINSLDNYITISSNDNVSHHVIMWFLYKKFLSNNVIKLEAPFHGNDITAHMNKHIDISLLNKFIQFNKQKIIERLEFTPDIINDDSMAYHPRLKRYMKIPQIKPSNLTNYILSRQCQFTDLNNVSGFFFSKYAIRLFVKNLSYNDYNDIINELNFQEHEWSLSYTYFSLISNGSILENTIKNIKKVLTK